jgi:hypothetical protein
MAAEGRVKPSVVTKAARQLDIDPEKTDPLFT